MSNNCNLVTFLNDEYPCVEDYIRYFDASTVEGLHIFQVNFRSIQDLNKFDLFKSFLSKFPQAFDIIILSESWLEGDNGLWFT